MLPHGSDLRKALIGSSITSRGTRSFLTICTWCKEWGFCFPEQLQTLPLLKALPPLQLFSHYFWKTLPLHDISSPNSKNVLFLLTALLLRKTIPHNSTPYLPDSSTFCPHWNTQPLATNSHSWTCSPTTTAPPPQPHTATRVVVS